MGRRPNVWQDDQEAAWRYCIALLSSTGLCSNSTSGRDWNAAHRVSVRANKTLRLHSRHEFERLTSLPVWVRLQVQPAAEKQEQPQTGRGNAW